MSQMRTLLSLSHSLLFLLLTALSVIASAPAAWASDNQSQTFDRLRIEHQHMLDQLNTGGKGGPVDLDEARVPELLNSGWKLGGEWAAEYLNNHPTPTTTDLQHIFDGFAPKPKGLKSQYGDFLEYHTYSFTGSVTQIASAVYVAQAAYWMDSSTGTFFVLARGRDGRFQCLWNIKDLAEKHYAQEDEIGRWAHLTRRAYYNGPLNVKRIVPLSPAANGHPRFVVDAFQSADGGTALAQLSIWEWNGEQASPLLIKFYQYTWDTYSFRFDGQTIRIGTKEDSQSFFSCGGCPEPRGVWRIRISPDGVHDLGSRFLQPELKWADELLAAINDGADTSKFARPEVVSSIRSALDAIKKQQTSDGENEGRFNWGMFFSFRRIRSGHEPAFELALDEARFRFTYVLRNGKPFFTSVKIT